MKKVNGHATKLWNEYRDLARQIGELEKEKRTVKDGVLKALGRAKEMQLPDGRVVKRVKVKQPEKIIPACEYETLRERKE